jgi:uncharacterized protein with HEPN domain
MRPGLMLHRPLYGILMDGGQAVGALVREMQDEDELFRSPLTLRALEAELLIMAHTLGNLTPMLHRRLASVDWAGWSVLHDKLRRGIEPRREEVWYAVNGLVPQTLHLLADLRRREPALFEWNLG